MVNPARLHDVLADNVRVILAAAPMSSGGPSTAWVVDFHGLRVHHVSRVAEAGASVKEAMELAQHSVFRN